MSIQKELDERSNKQCELCTSSGQLSAFAVEPTNNRGGYEYVNICSNCESQIFGDKDMDTNHWRCLNDAIWSEVDAVKVMSYRILNKIKSEGWPQDLLDMMYMEDEVLNWAKSGLSADGDAIQHIDSNGNVLQDGDHVVLVKDLNVKGGNFTAKRGTAVKNIKLDPDNSEYIEGKVENQNIVILTKFVKKN